MKKILATILCLMPFIATANVYHLTNNITLMTCTDRMLDIDATYPVRIKVQAFQSGAPMNLTNRYVMFTLTDLRNGDAVIEQQAEILDMTNGLVRWTGNMDGMQPANYEAKMRSYRTTNNTLAAELSCDRVVLSYSCSTCSVGAASGGSASITVNQTNINNITIDNSTTITGVAGVVTVPTNAYASPVTNSGVVTVFIPTNTGSGSGGITSINGATGAAHSIVGLAPIVITNFGDATYVGLSQTEGGVIIVPAWSNVSELTYNSFVTGQYVVGASKTQVFIEGWGPASAFGPGGYVGGYLTVTGGMILEYVVGQWGTVVTGGVAQGGWAGHFGKGGNAISTNGNPACSGGGMNWLRILGSTNFVAIVAGGGGAVASVQRSPGGGMTGYFNGGSATGGAGTQTNGGSAATSVGGASAGSLYNGGTNTAAGGANPGSAGSAGYYGGGGGAGTSGSSTFRQGGSGSSYIGGLSQAAAIRQSDDSANPPRTDSAYWKSPWGVSRDSITNNAHSNPGAWVIVTE